MVLLLNIWVLLIVRQNDRKLGQEQKNKLKTRVKSQKLTQNML